MWRLLRRPIAGRIACDSEGMSRALRMVPEIGELGSSRTLNFDDQGLLTRTSTKAMKRR